MYCILFFILFMLSLSNLQMKFRKCLYRMCFSPHMKALVSFLLIFSDLELKSKINHLSVIYHMYFSYTSDKDGLTDTEIQDSKYLPPLANEPTKVQLHCMASEKMHVTICNDESHYYHEYH